MGASVSNGRILLDVVAEFLCHFDPAVVPSPAASDERTERLTLDHSFDRAVLFGASLHLFRSALIGQGTR
jgi:hypothetical protein